jgi:hypothetical protein
LKTWSRLLKPGGANLARGRMRLKVVSGLIYWTDNVIDGVAFSDDAPAVPVMVIV